MFVWFRLVSVFFFLTKSSDKVLVSSFITITTITINVISPFASSLPSPLPLRASRPCNGSHPPSCLLLSSHLIAFFLLLQQHQPSLSQWYRSPSTLLRLLPRTANSSTSVNLVIAAVVDLPILLLLLDFLLLLPRCLPSYFYPTTSSPPLVTSPAWRKFAMSSLWCLRRKLHAM